MKALLVALLLFTAPAYALDTYVIGTYGDGVLVKVRVFQEGTLIMESANIPVGMSIADALAQAEAALGRSLGKVSTLLMGFPQEHQHCNG